MTLQPPKHSILHLFELNFIVKKDSVSIFENILDNGAMFDEGKAGNAVDVYPNGCKLVMVALLPIICKR